MMTIAYIRCLDCGRLLDDLASECDCLESRTLMIVDEDDAMTMLGQDATEIPE